MKLKVKKLHPDAKTPTKAFNLDLGYDLYCLYDKILEPGEVYVFPLGIACEIEPTITLLTHINNSNQDIHPWKFNVNVGCFIFDKSGVGSKGIGKLAGVIEATYRGEWKVVMTNHSDTWVRFNKGDKLCQLVIMPVFDVPVEEVNELSTTERGANGFGSTGR